MKPRIDDLEPRALLSTASLSAHPTFQVRSLAGGGGPSAPYTPAQIQQAYGFNSITFNGVAGTGSGETIAIVDAYDDPNIQADLNTFDTQFGLPPTTVTRVSESGTTSYPASDPTGGWELEESLDVEWAHAMAPGANILLVEASSTYDSDLLAAVSYAASHANVVSMSWGGGEFSGETAGYDSYFDHAGVAFVASSGDSGAPAEWPAASPNVLSVGGTALTLGPGNAWSSEVGWSGSGGGPSADELQPSYQKGVVTQTSTARATPDVAYDASPSTGVYVYDSVPYEGGSGWWEVGGTSAGAPQWSALLAIADQGRALNGQKALDSTNPQEVMNILYKNPADFHDITSGTSTGSPNYSAGIGYDYVTGMGSPIANLIVGSLDGTSTASYDKLVLTATPTAETAGTSFSLTVTAQNSSGKTDTGYTGTIQFTSSDAQAVLPANFTFVAGDAGTYTFTNVVTLKTAGSQSVTATDTTTSAITGTLSGITVSPAAASQFVLSGLPSSTTVGVVAQPVTVTAEDPYGNVATGYAGTVHFTSSDPIAKLP
ncbi:S53 family peptidase, partial [Mycobacterium sp.]|uniref:S53 family peptidase n=1 Tax=Mycobacterium sp. TaxID=1785 RepID=UPI003F9E6FFD